MQGLRISAPEIVQLPVSSQPPSTAYDASECVLSTPTSTNSGDGISPVVIIGACAVAAILCIIVTAAVILYMPRQQKRAAAQAHTFVRSFLNADLGLWTSLLRL